VSNGVGLRDVDDRPGQLVTDISDRLGDFTTSPRVLLISVIAIVVGTSGVVAGLVLLRLSQLCTNLAYFGRFSRRSVSRWWVYQSLARSLSA
jgi:hypothetical protein